MNNCLNVARSIVGALVALPVAASAIDVPLVFSNVGTVGNSAVFRADLSGLSGLGSIGAISIADDGIAVGGAEGAFSGFDLDAIFLDADGNLATSGDRTYASSFGFTAGTTRPTANPLLLPTGAHPGPTFGSLNATTIDFATATLNTLGDATTVPNVNLASGFLTLGDGGSVVANFVPSVAIPSSLFLITGEAGGQAGEGLGATVSVTVNVPDGSSTGLLLGMAFTGILAVRRIRKTTVPGIRL